MTLSLKMVLRIETVAAAYLLSGTESAGYALLTWACIDGVLWLLSILGDW